MLARGIILWVERSRRPLLSLFLIRSGFPWMHVPCLFVCCLVDVLWVRYVPGCSEGCLVDFVLLSFFFSLSGCFSLHWGVTSSSLCLLRTLARLGSSLSSGMLPLPPLPSCCLPCLGPCSNKNCTQDRHQPPLCLHNSALRLYLPVRPCSNKDCAHGTKGFGPVWVSPSTPCVALQFKIPAAAVAGQISLNLK